jgi:DNA-binding transcriptional LysR family regulator
VRLLDRTTRRLGLTQVGQQVFEHARAAVIEADAADEAALRMQAEPRGLVRLSCPLGLQEGIAASLPSFLAGHPKLRVECVITNRRVDLVHEGIDVAIWVRERTFVSALHSFETMMILRFTIDHLRASRVVGTWLLARRLPGDIGRSAGDTVVRQVRARSLRHCQATKRISARL